MRKSDIQLVVLSGALYAVLWLGAEIYGSYRYEPSGIQYVLLPFMAAPVCAVVGAALWIAGRHARARYGLRILPFVGSAVLGLPPVLMPLSNRNLEAARIATIAVGVIHAVLLLLHLVGRLRGAPAEPVAAPDTGLM